MDSPPKKNYLIIPLFEEERSCYEIYLIPEADLGRAPQPPLKPVLVISCRDFGWEICVLETTVYMICSNSKRISAFDLSVVFESPAVLFLKEEMTKHISRMRYPKRNVKAVPTPSGKILAFSRKIDFICPVVWDSYSEVVMGDFELYDPEKDSWEEIPPINWDRRRMHKFPRSMVVSSCGFIEESTFLIQADTGKIFLLHLEGGPGGYRWEEPPWGGRLPFSDFSRGMVGRELCLTPMGAAWDINNVSKCHTPVCLLPSAFGFNDAWPSDTRSRAIIFDKRSSRCFLLETAKDDHSRRHFLTIDVFLLDLVKYFEEKEGAGAKYLEKKLRLAEENRVKNAGLSLYERINSRVSVRNEKLPSLPSCVPELGCRLLSFTNFRLSPGSLSLRTLTDPSLTDPSTFSNR